MPHDEERGSLIGKVAFIVVLELFVIAFVLPSLRDVISVGTPSRMMGRPGGMAQPKATKIYTSKMVDKCHTFAGYPWPEEDKERITAVSDISLNPVSQALKACRGQIMCLLLYDAVRQSDATFSRYGEFFEGMTSRMTVNPLRDGVSYFYYDLGGSMYEARFNLYVASMEVGNIDVLVAPVAVDYVVISLLEPDHFAGGLGAMLAYQPDLPVVVPPGKDAARVFGEHRCEVKKLIVLPEGYTSMSERVGILVLPCANGEGFEADLVVRVKNGIGIVASAGRPGMEQIIAEAEKATGQKVRLYAGGTSLLMGMENAEDMGMMKRLRASHPDMVIYANATTSLMADAAMEELYGGRYMPVSLGTTLPLVNPSLFYRMVK
ncbi:MAG: hypothetical protein RDV48_29810 [Candidatus Eremiobacteraeota bacterium]|nr:hypothetical protein [Candidatus Eremiobacteraeota bacterium]